MALIIITDWIYRKLCVEVFQIRALPRPTKTVSKAVAAKEFITQPIEFITF
jgi:hypothetical protein